jgi:predicted nucleic acid-binding protein
MKELFEKLKRVDFSNKKLFLLDTCFFIHVFQNQHEHRLLELCKLEKVAMTTFNAEEFINKHHKLENHINERVRHFLKQKKLLLLDVPVHPGEWDNEVKFIKSTDPYLLHDVPDNSDGVLIAAAIRTQSTVLTRDKHDLFTTKLENYLTKYGLQVFNDLKHVL